jgi:hypothetical protein
MGKLGTGINANLNNAAATSATRIASANNGNTDYFSFDVNTLATLLAATFLQKANNLSDLANAATARSNLGLGSAALENSTAILQVANNLSDLANAVTARSNLGLGTAALEDASDILQVANNLSDVQSVINSRVNLSVPGISVYNNNPNGNVAGNRGDLVINTANNYDIYYCSVSGSTSTAEWVQLVQVVLAAAVTGTTKTLAPTDAFSNTLVTNTGGCTLTIDFNSLPIGKWAYFQRSNVCGGLTLAAGTGVLYTTPANSFNVVENGGVWIGRFSDGAYYAHGDLTA